MVSLSSALEPIGLQPGTSDQPDFATSDGSTILEIKDGQGGVRDLRAAVAQLALYARDPQVQRAILLVRDARMSNTGIREEWQQILSILVPGITRKLELIALLGDTPVLLPENIYLRDLAHRVGATSRQSLPRPDRSFEVMRVLLTRWLQNQGPISLKALGEQTGLSHPTVRKGLADLDVEQDRGVVLRKFPQAAWSRLLAMAPLVRQTQAFVDQSGRGADPHGLLRRLARCPPMGVAVAGVAAAHHWHPGFDLEGLPRLDLSVHQAEDDFVRRLDPALVLAPPGAPPVLVLHIIPRAASLFVESNGLPWADPVEVLLDLHELRLLEQADAMMRFLRSSR